MCIRLLLIVTHLPRTRGDASNNNPTTINTPLGAVHVPISTQDQATALVQIIHVIRSTRSHGVADWHPKAIEKTLFSNKDHPAPYGDIVVALTKYARDSDKHVPNFVFDALADWAPKGQTAPRTPCQDHAGQDARTCVCCASDILTGLRPPEYRGRHYDIPDTLETAMTRKDTP